MFSFELKIPNCGAVAGLLAVSAAMLFCTLPSAAEEAQAKLSVGDAVSMALNENANIKQAEARQEDSLSQLRVANLKTTYGIGGYTGLNRDPDNSGMSSRLFGSWNYAGLFGSIAELTLTPVGLGDERGAIGLTLRRPLIKGKGLLSEKADLIAGAQSDATVQEKELYLLRQSKVQDVVEAYYRAVLAREQVSVRERAVQLAEQASADARKRADAGLVAEIEVSRAEIRVAETKNQLVLQQQSARAAVDRLMAIIGEGVGENPELTDTVPEADVQVPGLADAMKTALANRAELAVYDEQLSNQERKLKVAQDDFRPELNAVAGFNSTSPDSGLISRSLYDLGSFTMGLEMRFPLDKRISVENQETTARGIDVLQRMRVYQMEQIAEQVRQAYRGVDSARSTLEIFSQNQKVAEDRLSIAQRMVEEGLETNREVLDAQESLTQLESSILSARTDLYLASINLKYSMGEDLTIIGQL